MKRRILKLKLQKYEKKRNVNKSKKKYLKITYVTQLSKKVLEKDDLNRWTDKVIYWRTSLSDGYETLGKRV